MNKSACSYSSIFCKIIGLNKTNKLIHELIIILLFLPILLQRQIMKVFCNTFIFQWWKRCNITILENKHCLMLLIVNSAHTPSEYDLPVQQIWACNICFAHYLQGKQQLAYHHLQDVKSLHWRGWLEEVFIEVLKLWREGHKYHTFFNKTFRNPFKSCYLLWLVDVVLHHLSL